jgi:hypothetical protein
MLAAISASSVTFLLGSASIQRRDTPAIIAGTA